MNETDRGAPGLIGLAQHDWMYAQLRTPEGRQSLADTSRSLYAAQKDRGHEHARYLQAADAIERCDWQKLGRLIAAEERERFERRLAELLVEHREVLKFVRRLAVGEIP